MLRTPVPLLLIFAGCLGGRATEFPPGLEPLGPNLAEWPAGDAETLSMASGSTETHDWAHARGYVHAPIGEVYKAITTPAVNVNRREVDEWETTWDVEPDYPHSYVIHNTVHDIITVEFDITWRHAAVEGSEEAPDTIASRWQKTDGSTVISLKEGSIVTHWEGPELTSIELQEHLASLSSNTSTIESYLEDLYADVLATVKGEPLPEFD